MRFYSDPGPSCGALSATFHFIDSGGGATDVTATVDQPPPSSFADYKAWSARAPYRIVASTNTVTLEEVGVSIHVPCGAHLDNPSLYQGLPWHHFPVPWEELDIADELDSPADEDARQRVCKDVPPADCGNVETFTAQ